MSFHPGDHRWLHWLGLDEPPPDPAAWIPVATDCPVEDPVKGSSETAGKIVKVLADGGVEAHQRAYVRADQMALVGPEAADRIRVAVLVHNRDLDRAQALLLPQ